MNLSSIFGITLPLSQGLSSSPIVEAVEGQLISATNDIDALKEWIDRYSHSPNTVAATRKDAERFYLWIQDRGLSLREVRKSDCENYRKFLGDPQPAELWCGPPRPRRTKEGLSNPEWRPFVGPLKDSSIRQTCTQIFGLYEFLCNAGYVPGNPWRLLGKLAPPEEQDEFIERFLDRNAMRALRDYIELMRDGDKIEKKHYARVRWIFSVLYLSGVRRSEFINAKMNAIRRINGKWWWKVKGKGSVVANVPVNEELLAELISYRESLGLATLPSPEEVIPLVSDVSGKLRPITASALYKLVKQVLKNAAEHAKNGGNIDAANILGQASTHWMRHTSATDQVNVPGADLKMVSKNLRHANISTTMRYVHIERDARHNQTQDHQMWENENLDPSSEVT